MEDKKSFVGRTDNDALIEAENLLFSSEVEWALKLTNRYIVYRHVIEDMAIDVRRSQREDARLSKEVVAIRLELEQARMQKTLLANALQQKDQQLAEALALLELIVHWDQHPEKGTNVLPDLLQEAAELLARHKK
jgi:hypothetical protein